MSIHYIYPQGLQTHKNNIYWSCQTHTDFPRSSTLPVLQHPTLYSGTTQVRIHCSTVTSELLCQHRLSTSLRHRPFSSFLTSTIILPRDPSHAIRHTTHIHSQTHSEQYTTHTIHKVSTTHVPSHIV